MIGKLKKGYLFINEVKIGKIKEIDINCANNTVGLKLPMKPKMIYTISLTVKHLNWFDKLKIKIKRFFK